MKQDKDFATGKRVNLSEPEEKVRQDFEKMLHEDFAYPKECMDIGVLIPIGSRRTFCDIALYASPRKKKIVGIIETKSPKDKSEKARDQLISYMSATPSCQWGAWTNGDQFECALRDIKTGEIDIKPANKIPKFGQPTDSTEIRKYEDLQPASNLKLLFRLINNRLYANTNLPKSEKQGAEMVRLIFCKLTDEYSSRNTDNALNFQIYKSESAKETRKRINKLWEETKKSWVGSPIFGGGETIQIDDYSLQLIVSMLQMYSLLKTDRDAVGDAFEVFSEKQFAGEKGQFFTPRVVVNMVVDMIAPKDSETILDPACGSGGFLIVALNHISKGKDEEQKRNIAQHSLYGIDKESDLSKICKAHMSIIGDGKSNIVTADSLDEKSWGAEAKSKLLDEHGNLKQFDVIMTNPPFGSKIKVEKEHILRDYDLGKKAAPPKFYSSSVV